MKEKQEYKDNGMFVSVNLPPSFEEDVKNIVAEKMDEILKAKSVKMLSIEQFSEKLGVCQVTARKVCKKIPSPICFNIGKAYRINEKLFDEWIAVKENAVKLERI